MNEPESGLKKVHESSKDDDLQTLYEHLAHVEENLANAKADVQMARDDIVRCLANLGLFQCLTVRQGVVRSILRKRSILPKRSLL